jgi:hypothetical protein
MSERDQPKAVRINSWGFETGREGGRATIPLFGIFLIVVGLLLAVGQLFPEAKFGTSAFFLALGIIFILAGLRDRNDVALVVGLFITALSAAGLLADAQVISGGGWGTLFLGIGFLGLIPIRASTGRGWRWAAAVGGLLVFWGGGEVASSFFKFDVDRLVGPLLLVLLGAWIVTRSRQGRSL